MRGGRARLRLDDRDVLPPVRIRALLMRPDEGNQPPVGRPGRQILVELRIGGQRIEAIRVDIEQVQVPPASRAQISFLILLEMQRIDHDGFGWRRRIRPIPS